MLKLCESRLLTLALAVGSEFIQPFTTKVVFDSAVFGGRCRGWRECGQPRDRRRGRRWRSGRVGGRRAQLHRSQISGEKDAFDDLMIGLAQNLVLKCIFSFTGVRFVYLIVIYISSLMMHAPLRSAALRRSG